MPLPPDLPATVDRADAELYDILTHPDDYLLKLLTLREVTRRRNLPPDRASQLQAVAEA